MLDKVANPLGLGGPGGGGAASPSTPFLVLSRLVQERWRDDAGRYALALLLMTIASAATAVSAWMMKDVVNDIFVRRDQAAMVWIPIVIVLIFLVKGAASYGYEVWLSRVGNRLVAEYQRKIYDHLLGMDLAFIQLYGSNELIMRTTQAAEAARGLVNLVALSLGRDLLTLIALIVVMVSQDPMMSLMVLVGGPAAALVVRKMGVVSRKAAQLQAATVTTTIGIVRETCQGSVIVKSFQLEDVLRQRMFAAIKTMEVTANKVATVRASVNPLIESLGGFCVAGVVAYAGWQATKGVGAPGHLFAFITALLLAADPARRLSRLHLELKTLTVRAALMFDILDTPAAEAQDGQKPDLVATAGEIKFQHVGYGYVRGQPVLRDLSLTARSGELTALVGQSGAGKTTVLGLLQRFWRADTGRIDIDGQCIDEISLASLRRNIALVSQDVFLFEGSIRDNLLAARPGASEAELKRAACAANADEFIAQLPRGYDTAVGELGNAISGGQRQRISIARAFLKNAPILLLDEPTSALDSEAETIIQDALRELMTGRTTIVIAHRLATVLRAHQIYVFDRGHVVECGTHDELVGKNGQYARLYRLQFERLTKAPTATSAGA